MVLSLSLSCSSLLLACLSPVISITCLVYYLSCLVHHLFLLSITSSNLSITLSALSCLVQGPSRFLSFSMFAICHHLSISPPWTACSISSCERRLTNHSKLFWSRLIQKKSTFFKLNMDLSIWSDHW